MKKIFLQAIGTGLLLLFLFSCDKNRVFEAYQKVPQDGWHNDSLVIFEIPIDDTIQHHNLYVNVRNNVNYKYSNLWLFINISQEGESGITDTLEILLADPAGRWLGEGFGGIKTQQIDYKGNVFFPSSGIYSVGIQQGMRDEVLKGITDIGFRVEKTN